MKKKLIKGLSIAMLFSSILPSMVSANTASDVSVKEAQKAALFQVVLDRKTNSDSPWRNKTVKAETPIPVYDASETQVSYIVNLTVDGAPAGYVEVGNEKDEYPILSFSRSGSQMDTVQINKLRQKKKSVDKKEFSEKVVLLGPAYFGLKEDFDDGSAEIITHNGNIELPKNENKPVKKQELQYNEESRKLWKKIGELFAGDIGSSSDGVTDDLSFETGIHNSYSRAFAVPDYNQSYSSSGLWNGLSGCSPTSAANTIYYWSANGYSRLTSGMTYEQVIADLRNYMGTTWNPQTDEGVTKISNIRSGIENYARNHGYSLAKAVEHAGPSWSTLKSDIEFGPNIITFTGQTYYNNGDSNSGHTVTGVGWEEYVYNGSSSGHQYMTIHDNWGVTPTNVYVAYGRNYSYLWSVKFAPYLY